MPFIRVQRVEQPGAFNFSRKIYHTAGLIVPLWIYFDLFGWLPAAESIPHFTRIVCLWLLAGFSVVLLIVDTLRFRWPALNAFFFRVVGPLLKEEEAQRYNATIPYFLICFFLLLYTSDVIATIGCIFLMIGDPAAAFVGSRYGRIRFWNGKSLEGLAAFLLAGALCGLGFLWMHTQLAGPGGPFALWDQAGRWNLGLLGSLAFAVAAASLSEFFSGVGLRGLFDDNLIVPLTGALAMALAMTAGFGFSPSLVFFNPAALHPWFPWPGY